MKDVRFCSPNIAVAIWASDLSMIYGAVMGPIVLSGFYVLFLLGFSFGLSLGFCREIAKRDHCGCSLAHDYAFQMDFRQQCPANKF